MTRIFVELPSFRSDWKSPGLTDQANVCGLSKRAYFARLIEGSPIRAKPSQEIKVLRWEVHKIGVNINQIARSVNARIARAEDARRGLYLLDQVYELMYQIAKNEIQTEQLSVFRFVLLPPIPHRIQDRF